jgi:hypothetical protein
MLITRAIVIAIKGMWRNFIVDLFESGYISIELTR